MNDDFSQLFMPGLAMLSRPIVQISQPLPENNGSISSDGNGETPPDPSGDYFPPFSEPQSFYQQESQALGSNNFLGKLMPQYSNTIPIEACTRSYVLPKQYQCDFQYHIQFDGQDIEHSLQQMQQAPQIGLQQQIQQLQPMSNQPQHYQSPTIPYHQQQDFCSNMNTADSCNSSDPAQAPGFPLQYQDSGSNGMSCNLASQLFGINNGNSFMQYTDNQQQPQQSDTDNDNIQFNNYIQQQPQNLGGSTSFLGAQLPHPLSPFLSGSTASQTTMSLISSSGISTQPTNKYNSNIQLGLPVIEEQLQLSRYQIKVEDKENSNICSSPVTFAGTPSERPCKRTKLKNSDQISSELERSYMATSISTPSPNIKSESSTGKKIVSITVYNNLLSLFPANDKYELGYKLYDANNNEVKMNINGVLEGKFYINKEYLSLPPKVEFPVACYRRNYNMLSIDLEFTNTPIFIKDMERDIQLEIESFKVTVESTSNFSDEQVELLVFESNKKSDLEGLNNTILMRSPEVNFDAFRCKKNILMKKFQFKKATPNNGKSVAKDYYYMIANLEIITKQNTENNKIRLLSLKSNAISVRGRNPSFYTDRNEILVIKDFTKVDLDPLFVPFCINPFSSPDSTSTVSDDDKRDVKNIPISRSIAYYQPSDTQQQEQYQLPQSTLSASLFVTNSSTHNNDNKNGSPSDVVQSKSGRQTMLPIKSNHCIPSVHVYYVPH